jgi:Zn-dependent M16 (insulinase) family peptidase
MCIYIPEREREIREARHSTVTVLLLIEIYYLLVFRLGSKKFNYLELSEQIALKTGGLNVSTHLDESSFRIEDYEEVRK